MEIIAVTREQDVKEPHITYCAEAPLSAAESFTTKFGIQPSIVYQKLNKGRSTCYVPVPEYIMQSFQTGVFYGVRAHPPT